MNKSLIFMLFLALSNAGCFTGHDSRSLGTKDALPAPLPVGPITADQIDAANAHRYAEAVWDEMDRDQQKDLLKENKKGTKNTNNTGSLDK
jgi:hypothetical protein